MKPKRSITVSIILIFLLFNILSIAIFTVYMQSNGKEAAVEYTRNNLLEMTREKSQLLAIAFDSIENRAELTGMYLEDMLQQETSDTLSSDYELTEDGTIVRKRDSSKKTSEQSNIIVSANTTLSEELIREINMTECLDRFFAEIIEDEFNIADMEFVREENFEEQERKDAFPNG